MNVSTAKLCELRVIENEPSAPDIWPMRCASPGLAASIVPGQFFNMRVPGDATHILRLPFSWSVKDADAGWVEFAYLLVGEGTRRMTQMRAGCESDLVGPLGNGWAVPDGIGRALVVGGGSGVVPTVPLVGMLAQKGVACDYVEGARSSSLVIYEDAIQKTGAVFHVSTDDGTRGTHGFTTDVASKLLKDVAYDVVYACGPTPMMRGIAALAKEAGVACQVSMEKLMACGFGACTTCLVDTVDGRHSVCKDGPVFDALEVLW